MFKRRQSTVELAKQALNEYRKIPVKFIDVPLEKALELSYAQNIYAYDAYLIQCAQQTSTSLLTLDNGLKRAAEKAGVQILEVAQ
jgi:predicted nucleic acid-binding protein